MRRATACAVLVFVIAACGSDDGGDALRDEAPPTTEREATPLPPLSVDIAGCHGAPEAAIEILEESLTGDATAVRLAYISFTDDGMTYLGGSIYDDSGFRLSSADTWIISPDGTIFALSGSANEYSDLPDGRDLPGGYSAGDEIGQALQDNCTIPALSA